MILPCSRSFTAFTLAWGCFLLTAYDMATCPPPHSQLEYCGCDEEEVLEYPKLCNVLQAVLLLGHPPSSGLPSQAMRAPGEDESGCQLPHAPQSQVESSGKLSAFFTVLPIRRCLELWSVKYFLTGLSYASVSSVMGEEMPSGASSVLTPDAHPDYGTKS